MRKGRRSHRSRRVRVPPRALYLRRTPRVFETLEPRWAPAVAINEFLAINTNGIVDQDSDHSDWIELANSGTSSVNVAGWYLTDDSNNLTKWQFPSTTIAAGGYLTVFASGKDRHVSGQELHANFTLNADGEYLALVMPDQTTIVSSFAPTYPAQLPDVSYGVAASSITTDYLVNEEAPVKVLVPTTNSVDSTWRATGFNDSSWLSGTTGVGYDTAPATNNDYGPLIDTDIGSQMRKTTGGPSGYVAYLRLPFTLADKSQLTTLKLSMRYDDGFVAYLNGVEVARRNYTTAGNPVFSSSATSSHSDTSSQIFEDIDITSALGNLVNGSNVLAIAGLNRATNSTDLTDFLIEPLLTATRVGSPQLGYQATPTPGAANLTASLGFVADTKFSVDRGFYSSPFTVQITTDTIGAQIRYTLDSSEPTATTGLVYDPQNPILISHTTILRAAAFKTGFTPSNIDSQTYIFTSDIINQSGTGLPPYEDWGHLGADWAMDPNIVNASTSNVVAGLTSIATLSLSMPWKTLFGTGGTGIYVYGSGLEKPVSMEYFTGDGSQHFQINAGIEIQGGTSDDRWKDDKLSFRVKFETQYGDSKLDFPLFATSQFDQGATTSFDTLILDGVLNNSWLEPQVIQNQRAMYVQDQVVADLQNLAGGYAPHGTYVNLYLDGVYWGIYYVHERPDDSFAAAYLGGDKEDYDVIKHNPTTPVNNSTTAVANYATLLAAVRADMTVSANYQAVTNLLDVKNFADYMIINYYVGNTDWAQHNWYAAYNKVSGTGKWRFFSWDAEHVFESPSTNDLSLNNTGAPTEIQQRLMVNSEYKLLFEDEIQRLMFNGGVLTPQSVYSVYAARLAQIDQAIYDESARWGDNQRNLTSPPVTYTHTDWRNYNGDFTPPFGSPSQFGLLANYFPGRTATVLSQFTGASWFPTLAAPTYSQFGGTVNVGFQVTINKPSGSPAGTTIYYTTDGSDPRQTGGAPNPSALSTTTSATVTVNASVRVKARIRDSSGNWSTLTDATFFLNSLPSVRITELNYNPADRAGVTDADDMEFIELMNTGTQTIDLNGMKVDRGVIYTFTTSTPLAAGARIVIARNHSIFQTVYGASIPIASGSYSGKLDNAGEEVRLLGPLGEVIEDFTYDDSGSWPGRADGNGSSLEIINPTGDPTDPHNWRSSYEYGGTPGAAGAGPANRVVVNEVFTHSDPPAVDLIELYNTTAASIDIGGWYLSDSSPDYKKYRIPNGTIFGAHQYIVFNQTQLGFGLDSAQGDDVWLLSADLAGNLQAFEDHVDFVAAGDSVSFGRWPNGSGDLYPMTTPTFASVYGVSTSQGANSGPRIGPIVITEVMYNPPGDNPDLEFVELTNLLNQPITLSQTFTGFESLGAQPWKINGLGFSFPTGTTIAANGILLVLHFDPANPANAAKLAAFQSAYNVGAGVQMVGGGTGLLDNAGETIQLQRPDQPVLVGATTVVPYVMMDEVDYQPTAPWPTSPSEELGDSLTRLSAIVYGDDPTNWVGAPATLGLAGQFRAVPGDTNCDYAVTTVDLNNVLNNYAQSPVGDTDGDGDTDLFDLARVLSYYGTTFTPATDGAPGSNLQTGPNVVAEPLKAPNVPVELELGEQAIGPVENQLTPIESSQARNSITMAAVASTTDDFPCQVPVPDVSDPSLNVATPQTENAVPSTTQSSSAGSAFVVVTASEGETSGGATLTFSIPDKSSAASPEASQELVISHQSSIELLALRHPHWLQQHQLGNAIFDEYGLEPQEGELLFPQAVSLLRSFWL